MVSRILDFLFRKPVSPDSIDEPSPLRPILKSSPLPVIEDDDEKVKTVMKKVREATRRKLICLETAVAILDDDDLHRVLEELPGHNS